MWSGCDFYDGAPVVTVDLPSPTSGALDVTVDLPVDLPSPTSGAPDVTVDLPVDLPHLKPPVLWT